MNNTELDTLRALVLKASRTDVTPEKITLETDLFEEGLGLDSFAVVELIMGIERAFCIQFREEDFMVENFANIRAIKALIEQSRCKT